MTSTVVLKVEAGRIAKFAEFATQADALEHLADVLPEYPGAFVMDGSYRSDMLVGVDGKVTTGHLSAQEVQAASVLAVQRRLDDFARTRGYDSILSACSYAASTVASFKAEGAYCVGARDTHWQKCYQIMAAVQAGTRPVPTVQQVLAEMPALAWPA
jgi:hypothetical protein